MSESMIQGAMVRRGWLPVARWTEGSEIIRQFWGFTERHALRRAVRWGAVRRWKKMVDRG